MLEHICYNTHTHICVCVCLCVMYMYIYNIRNHVLKHKIMYLDCCPRMMTRMMTRMMSFYSQDKGTNGLQQSVTTACNRHFRPKPGPLDRLVTESFLQYCSSGYEASPMERRTKGLNFLAGVREGEEGGGWDARACNRVTFELEKWQDLGRVGGQRAK